MVGGPCPESPPHRDDQGNSWAKRMVGEIGSGISLVESGAAGCNRPWSPGDKEDSGQ